MSNYKLLVLSILSAMTLTACNQKGVVEEKAPNSDTNIMESKTFKHDSAIEELKNVETVDDIKETKISIGNNDIEFKTNQVVVNHKDLELEGFDLQNRRYSLSMIDVKTKHIVILIGDIGKPKDATGVITVLELYPNGTYKKVSRSSQITVGTSPIELVKSSVKVDDKGVVTFDIASKDGKDSTSFELHNRTLKHK